MNKYQRSKISSILKYTASISSVSILVSCSLTPNRAKTAADKEVYDILKQSEDQVFKRKSSFNVASTNNSSGSTNQELVNRTNKKGAITLNLQDCIRYATINSRDYQDAKEDLYLTALNLSDSRETFSYRKSSSLSSTFQRQSDGDQRSSSDFTNGISKIFKSGGSLSLNLANDLVKYFIGSPDRSITSVISVSLVKPLLRGSGSKIAAENLTQSSRNVIYSIRDYDFFQQSFSHEIVIDYLRLLQQKEQVFNEKTNFESRQQNFNYLEARSIDRASPEEVADAEQEVLAAKTRLINAESSFETSLDNFKVTIGMPASMKLSLNATELEKLVSSGLHTFPLSSSSAYHKALESRHLLLNEIDRFEDQKRQVTIAANDLKADLDFITNASLANSGNRWERLNFDDISANIGLELDLPANRKRERNNYRRALISFDATTRSLSQTHDSLKNLINLRFRQLEQFKQNYNIQLGALELAKKRVEGNKLRLKAGSVIFRRLSESQDALISAQNAVTAALINYQETRLQLFADIGILNISKPNYWLHKNPTL